VIVTTSRQLIIPPEPRDRLAEIRGEIEHARNIPPANLASQRWRGRHLDPEMARAFRYPLALPPEE
jgi:hypothetical protein